jgi:hypothetical protein
MGTRCIRRAPKDREAHLMRSITVTLSDVALIAIAVILVWAKLDGWG